MWQSNLSTSIHNVSRTTSAELCVEVGTAHLRCYDCSRYVTRKKHLMNEESKTSLKNPKRKISYDCAEDTTGEATLPKKVVLAPEFQKDAYYEAVVLQLKEQTLSLAIRYQQQQVNLLLVIGMDFFLKKFVFLNIMRNI